MDATSSRLNSLKIRSGLLRPRKAATKIALGVLAATLIASSAIPAFAGKPHHEGHDTRAEQQQSPDVDAESKRKGNKNKSKSVTKSFASADAIAIPALDEVEAFGPADPYPSTIAVSGFKKAKITDLNLTLRGFSHALPRDVDLLLVAPDGRNAVILSDAGRSDPAESRVDDLTLTLDDEADTSLTDGGVLAAGTFRPFNLDTSDAFPEPAPAASANVVLSTFDGSNPNGEWRLFVLDDLEGDAGSLAEGWTLEITAKAKSKNKKKH